MTPLTRQELLRASGLAAFGVALGGCSLGSGDSHHPGFAQHGGDAWAWTKHLAGFTDGCDDLRLTVNGQAAKPTVKGSHFDVEAALDRPQNTVSAACGTGAPSSVVYRQRLQPRPTARIAVSVKDDTVHLDGSSSAPTEPSGAAIASYAWAGRAGNPQPLSFTGGTDGPAASLHVPSREGEYYLNLEVKDADGNSDRSTSYFVVDGDGARAVNMDRESPGWIASAIVYGVIPFLFGSPPLKAVTERIPSLADLGVNALWMAPVTMPATGDYGYAVADYFRVNDQYGTAGDMRTLVDTAHQHGIRVLIDFVPNHTSDEHPYFRDAQKNGRHSPYWSFYDRDQNGDYTHYFDWDNLPNLNYDNPEVRRFMTEAFAYWVREFDVDGFRTDAVWGVKRRYPEYWPQWRRELKRIKPDLLLIAEASALDDYYVHNGFDIAYDWTHELGHWAWSDVFYDVSSLAASLADALTADPEPAKVFHFLNNNDTGARFVSTYDSDVTRVATALLLTLPGLPCIYTGDEIGAQFDPYQDRNPIVWSDDHLKLRAWHRQLCHLRRDTPSLHSAEWELVPIEPKRSGLFAFVRAGEDRSDPLLVVLNFARDVFDAQLRLPPAYEGAFGGELSDLLSDRRVAGGSGTLSIHLPAVSSHVFRPRGAAA